MPAKVLPPEKQCDGKFKHSWESAHKHKAQLGYDGLEVYACPHCGYVHVGHSAKRRREYKRVRVDWTVEAWRIAQGG